VPRPAAVLHGHGGDGADDHGPHGGRCHSHLRHRQHDRWRVRSV